MRHVGLREHADQLVLAHHDRQPPHLLLGHHSERVVEVVLRGERRDIARGHVADNRGVGVQPAGDDAHGHVTVGDDADQPLSLVDHRQRADVFFIHQPRGLAHGGSCCHGARPLGHQL